MPDFSQILREVGLSKFSEILGASTRQAREIYFHRHNIKVAAAPSTRLPKPGAKNEAKTQALYNVLQQADDPELAEEVLRTWLLGKREMLAAALTHLGIPHKEGLTESNDIEKFEKLSSREAKTLVEKLGPVAPREDVLLYLKFMGVPKVHEL